MTESGVKNLSHEAFLPLHAAIVRSEKPSAAYQLSENMSYDVRKELMLTMKTTRHSGVKTVTVT